MSKTPFSLTYILYNKEDGVIGWAMALMSLAPVFFVCILCSSVLLHRDMHSVFFLIEMLLCTIINQIIKHIIKQPRPMTGGVQQSYGMPSDHCQFMSCFCVYFTLWLCRNVTLTSRIQKILGLCILWITWILVIYSRIYLEEHTLSQVVVGILVGSGFGLLWYVLNERVFRPYYPLIASTALFQWFEFKDYTHVTNVFDSERRMAESTLYSCVKND